MITSRHRFLTWFSITGVGLTLIGLGGLSWAFHVHPDSNLLGGWGLIFGPIYWFGLVLSLVAALAWSLLGLRWLWLKKMKPHD